MAYQFGFSTSTSARAIMAFWRPEPACHVASSPQGAAPNTRDKTRKSRRAVSMAINGLIGAGLLGAGAASAQTLVTGATTQSGTIDGSNNAGYFVNGTLTINNGTVQNFTTTGGTGSGGGAGFGGAIFVNTGGSAVLNGVNFSHNSSVGGNASSGAIAGGTLNNGTNNGYFAASGNGGVGANGIAVPDNSIQFGDGKGNGIAGVFVGNGGNASNGFGGVGGIGGAGTNGWSSNPVASENLSISAAATSTAELVRDAGIAQLVVNAVFTATEIGVAVGIGADPLSGAADKAAFALVIARGLGDIAFDAVNIAAGVQALEQAHRTQALAQQTLDAWYIAAGLLPPVVGYNSINTGFGTIQTPIYGTPLSQSLVGNGGNGQNGGNAGNGTFGFGGGAGGQGGAYGLGGTITLSGNTANSQAGTGGNGGAGGAGGFGAGGGSGGYGFGVGQNGGTSSSSGVGGMGGSAGFGGGAGSTGGVTGVAGSTGGGGGQGYGGAIFVNSGGSLTLTGNATFTGNNAIGGSSLNGGQAGTGSGTDLFMMTGSSVRIAPGAGNTITFNGSIADNSISSIGASASVGSGAGLTTYAGTTIFNGSNTYSGQTVIRGNALSGAVNTAANTIGAPDYNTTAGGLRAQDRVGLPTNSNLRFDGPNMGTGGVLETNGVFNRWVGTNSNRVQWTGSGGFAAVDGPLMVTLNEYRPGMGTQLTWGASNFVGFGSSLMFGSANSTHGVTFNNAVNISGGYGAIMVADNGTAGGSTATMAGVLSGNGGLIVNGFGYNGTLNIGAANTYTGATVINSGILALTAAGSISNSAGVALAGGGTLDISGTTSGAAIQTLGSSGGAGNVALGSKTLTITAGLTTFTGVIADGGSSGGTGGGLTVTGGTQTLTGANTYTGGTTIDGGSVLALSGVGSIGSSSGAAVNNGTLDISQTTSGAGIKTLSGAGNVALGGQVLSITAGSTTFSGVIANGGIGGGTGGSLNVAGGTQTLTGTNTFTGSTNINAGSILALANSGAIATSSVIQSNGKLDISQTTAGAAITTLMGLGDVALGNQALTITNGLANLGFAGTIKDGGLGGGIGGKLNVSGGTQNLIGANTYTGFTAVDIGAKLNLIGAGAIASSSVVVANGTFDISNTTSGAAIKTLAGLGSVALGGQPLIITAGTTTFSGVISGSGGLNVTGGTQVLDFNTNTYTGATTISSGAKLALNSTGSIAASSGVANNGTFNIATTTAGALIKTLSGNGGVTLGAQTLTLTSAHDTFSGVVSGSGGLTVAGGAEVLTGVNTYSGATNVNAGAGLGLSAAGSIAASSVVNANGLVDISATTAGTSFKTLAGSGGVNLGSQPLTITNGSTTFAGMLYGTGGLTIAGGTETLSGANTYTGQTTINSSAALALSGSGSIATSSGVANAGTLNIASHAGPTAITTLSGNGSVALGSNTLAITNGGAGASASLPAGTFSGVIGGTGAVAVTGGYQNLNGVNTYSGGTTVQSATLGINSNASLGAASGAVTMINGVIIVNGNVTANRPTSVTGANTINTGGNAVGWNGLVSGTGSLSITGGGTFSLAGTNTFTGGLIVANGTNVSSTSSAALGAGPVALLTATGSALNLYTGQVSISGPLQVVNGATQQLIIAPGDVLSGTGTINVSTLVQGSLAPGNSPGTLTFAAPVALAAGSTFRVEVDGPTSSAGGGGAGTYDSTIVTGAGNTFTAGGVLTPVLRGISGAANNNYTPPVTTSFAIVQAQGGVLGSFSSLAQPATGLAPGTRFDALYFPTSISLYVTPSDYRNLSAFNVSLNANQSAVAGAVNAMRGDAGPANNATATRDLSLLYAQQPGSLPRVFNTLSGEVATGARTTGARTVNQFMAMGTEPANTGQTSGQAGNQAGGQVANAASGPMGLGMGERLMLGGASDGVQSTLGPVTRWTGWGSAFTAVENRSGDSRTGSHDLNASVYGLATGASYRFGDSMLAGFSIAAGNAKWSLAENLGNGKSESYMASLYGRAQVGAFYLAATGAAGTHGITTTRVAFTGETLNGKHDAQSYGGRAEAGVTVRGGAWSLSPYAAFQTQVFNAPGYSETGGGFALAFKTENTTINRSEVGARVEARTTVGNSMPLYLRARAAWVHDGSSSPSQLATFSTALQPGGQSGAATGLHRQRHDDCAGRRARLGERRASPHAVRVAWREPRRRRVQPRGPDLWRQRQRAHSVVSDAGSAARTWRVSRRLVTAPLRS